MFLQFDDAPERLGRHAHHHVVGLAGHQALDGSTDGLAQHVQELHEVVIVGEIRVLDHEAAEVPGHTARDDSLAVIFHRGICRWNNDSDLGAMTDVIVEMTISTLVTFPGSGQVNSLIE